MIDRPAGAHGGPVGARYPGVRRNGGGFGDLLFRALTRSLAIGLGGLLVAIAVVLTILSWPSIRAFGLSFVVSTA